MKADGTPSTPLDVKFLRWTSTRFQAGKRAFQAAKRDERQASFDPAGVDGQFVEGNFPFSSFIYVRCSVLISVVRSSNQQHGVFKLKAPRATANLPNTSVPKPGSP